MTTEFEGLIRTLNSAGMEYILVNLAATVHGSARATYDVDVVYSRSPACLSLDRLIEVKRAAGRPKDLEAIAELEALREERRAH